MAKKTPSLGNPSSIASVGKGQRDPAPVSAPEPHAFDMLDDAPVALTPVEIKRMSRMVTRIRDVAPLAAQALNGSHIPADVVRAYKAINALESAAKKAKDVLKAALIAAQSLPMEEGATIKYFVKDSPRVNPAWKDEATKNALELANLRSVPFSPEVYEAKVKAMYPSTPTYSIEILGE